MLQKTYIIGTVVLLLGCACSKAPSSDNSPMLSSAASNNSKLANIVIVITDDQGYGDLGIHGNPTLKTPNIDKLARQSVSLENYHVSPTCSPTRGAFLTGRYSNRTGVWHTIMGRSMLRENEVTVAGQLKSNGYHTAMFGKWHLGDNYPYRPIDRGFDLSYYHGGGGVGQTPDFWNNAYFDGHYFRNGRPEAAKGYVTDVFFNEAIKYIDAVKDSGKPFFAYLATNAPHGPMHAPQKYADIYEQTSLPVHYRHFYGMITNIDDNVARLRRYLSDNGLSKNTIFIYTTDNGSVARDPGLFNAGMRGHKGSEYDGGHRVPFFIHWPAGGLNKQHKISQLTAHVDIMPTLLELSRTKHSSGTQFDGVSLKPSLDQFAKQTPLSKQALSDFEQRMLVTDSQRVLDPIKWRKSAVMQNSWRLINGKELYDLAADPGQENDIANKHPRKVETMRAFYDRWWDDIAPSFGEPAAIYIGSEAANPVDLSSHDWLGSDAEVPWNQAHIRKALREDDGRHSGFWWINVVSSGRYSLELRRWPQETNTASHLAMLPAAPVPGDKSYRNWPGHAFNIQKARVKIGDDERIVNYSPLTGSVNVDVLLEKGRKKLQAAFIDEQGLELGAYYVRVTKR